MLSSYPFGQLTCSSSSASASTSTSSPHGHGQVFPASTLFSHDNSDEDSLIVNQQQPAKALICPCPYMIGKYGPCWTTCNNKAAAAAIANPHSDSVMGAKKGRARKGGHSKIFTGQGLRDRRVRLSIKIARKFFNLQDKLGFDRPSKTLSWLFTNSKVAIEELVTNYKLINSSSSFESCELDMILKGSAVGALDQDQEVVISKQNPAVRIGIGIGSRGGKENRARYSHKSALYDYFLTKSKESREKARARARERTLQKQRIREFNSQIPHPSLSCNEIGFPYSKAKVSPMSSLLVNYKPSRKDITVEAILTCKKQPVKPSTVFDYQQNLATHEIKFSSSPRIRENLIGRERTSLPIPRVEDSSVTRIIQE